MCTRSWGRFEEIRLSAESHELLKNCSGTTVVLTRNTYILLSAWI